jgi:hypothetical protein
MALYAAKHAGRNRVDVASAGRYGSPPDLDKPRQRAWEKPTSPSSMVLQGVWQQHPKKPER